MQTGYVQTQEKALIRDTFSKGLINTNKAALNDAKTKHAIALAKMAEDRRKSMELNLLRQEVNELKELVHELVAGIQHVT